MATEYMAPEERAEQVLFGKRMDGQADGASVPALARAFATAIRAAENDMAERAAKAERQIDRLLAAIKGLGKIRDGRTLFEGSPVHDPECYAAWTELNHAIAEARGTLKHKDPA